MLAFRVGWTPVDMETIYYTQNGSRRSGQSRQSQTSRVTGSDVCRCDRDNSKNITLLMSLVTVLGLTAALLVLGLSTHRQYTTIETESQLRSRVLFCVQLFNSGKFSELSELYTTDSRLLVPGREVLKGRTAILRYFKATKMQITESHVTEVEIISDVRAYSSSEYDVIVNGVDHDRRKSLVIWKRIDGLWKIYRETYNSSDK